MEQTTCQTCLRSAENPYRQRHAITREILGGCIDEFHAGHLMPTDNAWHNRPEAKKLRKRMQSYRAQCERDFQQATRRQHARNN